MLSQCKQQDCDGHYGEDSFCDECGARNTVTNATTGPKSAAISAVTQTTATGTIATSVSQPTRSSTQSATGSTRSGFGGGMNAIPPVPIRNPSEAVLADPKVPESKRNCSVCGKPVGRGGADGSPGRVQGFCPHCRNRFSFVPSLQPGDLVVSRYEILGAIAHGGLGWIYLARDQNIGDDVAERWVVLKGLIDTSDPDAIDSAIAERRFLAALDHPNIVQIYDFARHPDPRTNQPLNYIVMEYVPGQSLRDLRREYRDDSDCPAALPLSQVLTYGAEILPALGYLHQQGLLFCDFKPDNVIHVESWLKLIDLGAVRRIDDNRSAVFGTPGYSVSDGEIVNHGPSISSDLYTVARSMAVLAFDFHGFTGQYRNALPSAQQEPLFARHESFYRFLKRATHDVPAERFGSAADMLAQLEGVQQEVLSVETGVPCGSPSGLFTSEQLTFGSPDTRTGAFATINGKAVGESLPLPLVDTNDPSAAFLATMSATSPAQVLDELKSAPERSPEVRLRSVRAHIAADNLEAASQALSDYANLDLPDWRIRWWQGITALLCDAPKDAYTQLDGLYSHLPGEIAPALALAAAAELCHDVSTALGLYTRVWQTDRRYVSAAFGQARLLAADGHNNAAIAVLDTVPATSSRYSTAQVSAIALRIATQGPAPQLTAIRDAADRLTRLDIPPHHRALLTVRILHACLAQINTPAMTGQAPILDTILTEKTLRFALERTYRQLARTSTERHDRIQYIDQANMIRPWTMV